MSMPQFVERYNVLLARQTTPREITLRIIQGWRGTRLNALGLRQARLMSARVRQMGVDLTSLGAA